MIVWGIINLNGCESSEIRYGSVSILLVSINYSESLTNGDKYEEFMMIRCSFHSDKIHTKKNIILSA